MLQGRSALQECLQECYRKLTSVSFLRKVTESDLSIRGAGVTVIRKSEFRLGENVIGGQNVNKHLPGSGAPQSLRPPGRDPENHKIRCFSQRGSEASPERPRGVEVGSKAAPGAKREAKSSLLGASGEAFWGEVRDSGPLRKHKYLL